MLESALGSAPEWATATEQALEEATEVVSEPMLVRVLALGLVLESAVGSALEWAAATEPAWVRGKGTDWALESATG